MNARRTAVVVRHMHFQSLGMFEPALQSAGYDVRYCDIGIFPMILPDPIAADLLVILGGPISAYDAVNYPFLTNEIDVLKRRMELDRPTFGVGLGAQLIAQALGAKVYPGQKEIGFSPYRSRQRGVPPLCAILKTSPCCIGMVIPFIHFPRPIAAAGSSIAASLIPVAHASADLLTGS